MQGPGALNIIQQLFITGSTNEGIYIYFPSIATGNIKETVMPIAGTTPTGDQTVSGWASYTVGSFACSVTAGELIFYKWAGAVLGWIAIATISASGNNLIINNSAGQLQITGSTLIDVNTTINNLGINTFGITANGEIVANSNINAVAGTPANPTIITTDTWNSLGAITATGYTSNLANYRLTNDGLVEFDIQLTANAGGGTAGTYLYANTLPATPVNYRPTNARSYAIGYNGTITNGTNYPALRIGTNGGVEIQIPALPAGTVLSTCQRMPLT